MLIWRYVCDMKVGNKTYRRLAWGMEMHVWSTYLYAAQRTTGQADKKEGHQGIPWVRDSPSPAVTSAWCARLTIPLLALDSHWRFPEHITLLYMFISLYMPFPPLSVLLSFFLPSFIHLVSRMCYARISDWLHSSLGVNSLTSYSDKSSLLTQS